MIEKLALRHKDWVEMARSICKDDFLADDLVSDMYLKLIDKKEEINNSYVYVTIKHLYYNYLKARKKQITVESIEGQSFKERMITEAVPYDNSEPDTRTIPDCLTWTEKQILLLRQENSCRDIHKQYNINYIKVHRIEKQAKEKLKEWLEKSKGSAM